jgi:2-aminobenzoate-CoA ligase
MKSAHVDTFAGDNLPDKGDWPEFLFELPELRYPTHMNAASELLDNAVAEGFGDKIAIYSSDKNWTYSDVLDTANRIANLLASKYGLLAGNRVLLRAANNPMMAACWFAVLKAGAIAVATMPLLRAKELATICNKGKISHALCDNRLNVELELASPDCDDLETTLYFGPGGTIETEIKDQPTTFANVETHRDDVALLAFTSGTTGKPKATMHFHRDVMAMADSFSRYTLKSGKDEVFAGTPPIAFTFGLGAVIVFPFHARASTILDESASPKALLETIARFRVTSLFTAPTAYRAMLGLLEGADLSSLTKCVSAGEALPKATSNAWFEATGIRMIDGIGATELIHIFISASGDDIRPGSTGKPVPGYRACIIGENDKPLGAGKVGRLAVKGPTGCRYLDDPRQKDYVVDGWNVTGDAYLCDEDGYYWYQARADDMIISGGYNIAGPEVEDALLTHAAVGECAVVSAPDDQRGNVVKAFIILREGFDASDGLAKELQDFVKATIAPFKYPRQIQFTDQLPKTQTGKIQRFKLRQK